MKYIITTNRRIERTTESVYAREFCDETTAPIGVSPKYHLRGREVWTWGHQGNFPKLVKAHDTVAEAREHLHRIYLEEAINNGNAPQMFDALDDAIEDGLEDQDADGIVEFINAQDSAYYGKAIQRAALTAKRATRAELADAQRRYDEARAEAASRRASTEAWNRKVQAANARADASAAFEVADRLQVAGGTIVFDGESFDWSRNEHGTITIDHGLVDAARRSGLHGQAVGEFYSIAQRMASQA